MCSWKFREVRSWKTPVTESFFIKKETLAPQVFYCEFCQISQNTFFTEHLWVTASVIPQFHDFMATSVVSV